MLFKISIRQLLDNLGLIGLQKIYAQFRIDKKGRLDKIRVRGPQKN